MERVVFVPPGEIFTESVRGFFHFNQRLGKGRVKLLIHGFILRHHTLMPEYAVGRHEKLQLFVCRIADTEVHG